MAHSAQFFTLDEVNPCCRPAPDNADRYTDFGRCWRVKSLQNCTMSTCTKKLSGRLWLKPVSGSPANNVRRKFSNRLACCGELIQIDGCDHHWFENRAPDCTALVYVDDATSHLMQLRFVKSESTFTYFEAIRGYLEKQDHIIRWRKDSTDWLREVIMLPLMHTLSNLQTTHKNIYEFYSIGKLCSFKKDSLSQ